MFVLIACIAFSASFVSGLVGLGGAVLLIPAYLYLPSIFRLAPLGIREISGMTSVQVLASALLGVVTHERHRAVDLRLALTMGIPITLASLVGAVYSKAADSNLILGVFASMAIAGAVLIVMRHEAPDDENRQWSYNVVGAVAIAIAVGVFAGIVGAPGGFLLSPIMIAVLRIPTRVTVGTTLAIVVLSAFGASAGKLLTGQVPLIETLVATAAALPGAFLGSRSSYLIKARTLRHVLAAVIFAAGAQIWYRLLS